METLTSGERIIRCLIGQEIDRVPYGVGIGWAPWTPSWRWSGLGLWQQQAGKPSMDLEIELGYDKSFAVPAVNLGPCPDFGTSIIEEDGAYIVSHNPWGSIKRELLEGPSMPEIMKYPVKNRDDWERFKAERLDPKAPGRITEDWNAFRARLDRTGEAVQVGFYPWGVFGTPRELMGNEEVLVAFYDDPDMMTDMMQHLTTVWISVYEQVAREVQIDHIHIWEDMSGRQGSLISPDMIEQFMMPCYDRIAAFARAHGVRVVSVDTDGDCAQLMPVFTRHGINAMWPFEVQAGNDILAIRRQYPELGIFGGLDKRVLEMSRKDVDREIDRAAAMAKQGRYIPGWDHLIPPEVTWDMFEYASRRLREVCYTTRPAVTNRRK